MSDIRFTKDHEWIRINGDAGTVGITDYAQGQLGDVVFVDLPEIGRKAGQGKEIAVVESVKAASEIYAPMSGEVIEVNKALADNPALVNQDPLNGGWFLKLRLADKKESGRLMDEAAYAAHVKGLG
jgi:glycine cleavage system H protein